MFLFPLFIIVFINLLLNFWIYQLIVKIMENDLFTEFLMLFLKEKKELIIK